MSSARRLLSLQESLAYSLCVVVVRKYPIKRDILIPSGEGMVIEEYRVNIILFVPAVVVYERRCLCCAAPIDIKNLGK